MTPVGKTAVVTGGGRGIGAAVARALASSGGRVVVAARSRDQVEAVADEVRAGGGAVHATVCDVADPHAVRALADESRSVFGPVDILVNNAGVARSGPFRKITLNEWEFIHRVNATGPFLCTQAFLPAMLHRGWGRIVNMASVASHSGARYIAAYAASKHALLGMTRCLAAELAGTGVTVNAVCPGYVDTPMTDESVRRIAAATGRDPEEVRANLAKMQPEGRLVTAREVARAVMTFVADESASFQGSSLIIDGGGLLR